jgi:hypothetical protein
VGVLLALPAMDVRQPGDDLGKRSKGSKRQDLTLFFTSCNRVSAQSGSSPNRRVNCQRNTWNFRAAFVINCESLIWSA